MNTLNPVFKLLGILIPTFLLAAFHNPILNIIVFVICIILMLLSKVSFKRLFLLMLPILLVAVGMFFTGYHFQVQEGAPVNPDSLDLTNNAIWNGMIFSSRVLAYAGLGFLFVLTFSNSFIYHLYSHMDYWLHGISSLILWKNTKKHGRHLEPEV